MYISLSDCSTPDFDGVGYKGIDNEAGKVPQKTVSVTVGLWWSTDE